MPERCPCQNHLSAPKYKMVRLFSSTRSAKTTIVCSMRLPTTTNVSPALYSAMQLPHDKASAVSNPIYSDNTPSPNMLRHNTSRIAYQTNSSRTHKTQTNSARLIRPRCLRLISLSLTRPRLIRPNYVHYCKTPIP